MGENEDLYDELLGLKKMQKVAKERLHPPPGPITWREYDEMTKDVIDPPNLYIDNSMEGETENSRVSVLRDITIEETSSNSKLSITEKDLNKLKEIMAIPGYWRWVTHGDTKRSFYIAQIPDKSSRVTYEEMSKDLSEVQEKVKIVKGLPPELLKELKEKIKERRVE